MAKGIVLTLFLIVFAAALPLIYATDSNTVEANFSEVKPRIDGEFTSESEWDNASVTNFQSNGRDFFLLSKQDINYVYLMLDGVDFQTDPERKDVSVRYQSTICFDTNNDKGSERQPDDFCHTYTVNNEFGNWTMSQIAPKKFDSEGNPSHLDLPPWSFRDGWGFGSQNDQFEQSDHLTYEIRVPKKMLRSEGDIGFTFEMYFDSAHDELVQLVDGIVWPSESDKEDPSTWGTLFLPRVECQKGLELVFKTSDSSPVCITPETKLVLAERGWAENTDDNPQIQPADPACMNLATIKQNVRFDLKTPAYLPEEYSYLCGDGLEGSSEARLLYGKPELKDSTGLIGEAYKHVDRGAIFLYSRVQPDQEQGSGNYTAYILDTIREANQKNPSIELRQISINGNVGWANERCGSCGEQTADFTDDTITHTAGAPSRIKFADENNVVYFFQANIPLEDLVRVAESVR